MSSHNISNNSDPRFLRNMFFTGTYTAWCVYQELIEQADHRIRISTLSNNFDEDIAFKKTYPSFNKDILDIPTLNKVLYMYFKGKEGDILLNKFGFNSS